MLALVAALPLPTLAHADPAPAPSITERYALADRYLRDDMDKLIADRDPGATFVAGGRGVLFIRKTPAERTIFFLDPATGSRRPIATYTMIARLLAAATAKLVDPQHVGLDRPDYDPATAVFSFAALGKRWTLDAGGALAEAKTGEEDGTGSLSPDGRLSILARAFNLVAVEVKTGREVALTTDGTREQPYGRGIAPLPEILKQGTEVPVMPVSVRWSPDSRRIITWRLNTRGVHPLTVTQENPPGDFYPRSFSYIYPLAGAATLPQATRLAIDVEQALRRRKATLVPLQVPSESLLYPADPDMEWVAGKPRMSWTERGYKQVVVYAADPDTGAAHVVAREAVKPVVTVTASALIPAPQLGGELSISERSGWAQLYLVRPDDPDGGIPLTRGNWEVLSVDHVSEDGRTLLITGVGRERDRNPYYSALYRVTLDGSQPVLLTPEPLEHETQVSDDGRWIIDRMSSPTVPTRTVIRAASDGHVVTELAHADPSALMATGFTPPEPFQGVAADGKTTLYGMILRPAHFDPSRRYPVIDNVYTGPTTTDVPTSWDGAVMAGGNSVAQIGAIVVMIDGRGTSRRGQAFRLPAYQNLGEVGLDDHIAMIRQMAARYPYMDATRVGVFGGSAGGYDAARFILRRPGFFKVAVASSGNHDLRLDKAWWPEVSMGFADQATWARNSNMAVAANLQGKLLLIHGDMDDNVPVTESFRLAQALIQAKRDVDIVVLPNTTHAVYQPFFWRKLRDYFTRNLLDEAPPALLPLSPSPTAPAEPPRDAPPATTATAAVTATPAK
ncbi:prolyl oligopeptidase family serine peptidase [Sphingomonas sp. GC_Shp_1]|uniref:S9 family peptidase n=1 Tax=unclassified Sphingomonas TaxID=196159 RepID=UPI002269CB3D